MVLVLLKQKLFPNARSNSSQSAAKALLPESPTHDGLSELEAQRSYRTFRDDEGHSSDAETASNRSARSRINPRIVSDAILGLSDGLTVPFALSAGLSALGDTKVVVLGGLAELAAGAISMGLGGYVGAKSELESYNATVRDAQALIETSPSETATIVRDIFATHGITDDIIDQIIASLRASPERHLDFLIDFHHKEARPDCNQAWMSATTLAVGYFVGGFIPLIPYFVADAVIVALYWSIAVMGVTLLAFGYIKTGVVRGWTGADNVVAAVKGGVQMCFVGGVAAGAAIGLVRVINGGGA